MAKNKVCRGTGKAKGHGCGIELPFSERNGLKSYKSKYGLGLDCKCYAVWLTTTDEGKELMNKATSTAKKKVAIETKKKNRQEKEKAKLDLISVDKYRADYLQPVINKIARLIDYGHPCIATGNYGKMNGGHYISVGANRTICLNLHNIFIQSFASNHWKSGDPLKYQQGLIEVFGEDYFSYVTSLSQHKPIKLTKEEMIEIRGNALEIVKELSRENKCRTSLERIKLRNEINLKLGIYDHKFCEYKWQKN